MTLPILSILLLFSRILQEIWSNVVWFIDLPNTKKKCLQLTFLAFFGGVQIIAF